MLTRSSGLSRLLRISPLRRSIRYNSTHHANDAHHSAAHNGPQGDGRVRLVSPGFLKASIFVGFMYCVYLWDQSIAKTKKDRIGPLHQFVNWAVAPGEEYDVYYAGIEETRQRNMDHLNLGQRPKYRVSYPEGANLGNPYGLTAKDRAAKTKRASDDD